jgi:hypothetical protein
MEEVAKDKTKIIEDHLFLKYFEDVFRDIPGFPPKKDIDFSIDLVLGATPMFKNPYRMGTHELKEM